MFPSNKLPTVAGYQNWRHLVFLHWRTDPDQLQRLLPDGLTVECFDGSAWLALVPFSMERVRPWWSPPVPGISWFLETNVRTYVRHESGLSAVWFFSLDANSRLAVWVARTFWKLNYINCQMTLNSASASAFRYTGRRVHQPDVEYEMQIQMQNQSLQTAAPESLDHFLLERYALITHTPDGQFLSGNVHHEPYPFRIVDTFECHETYTANLLGEGVTDPSPAHVAYSPGVDVTVTALQPIK